MIDTRLIDYFHVTVASPASENDATFVRVNRLAIQLGYIVTPEACTDDVYQWLVEQNIDINSTFYKTYSDVVSKSRFQLFIDQLAHYASTYGTGFECGNGYVPNDGDASDKVNVFDRYTIIKAVSAEEMFDKCLKVICSGVALKNETCETLVSYILSDGCKNFRNKIVVDDIANREAMIRICEELDIRPRDKYALFKYIIYVTTGKTMVIKNKELISAIWASYTPFDFSKLSEEELKKLASIYYRYKDLFCAFKHISIYRFGTNRAKQISINNTINKLNRMAKKFYEPMTKSCWDEMLTGKRNINEFKCSVVNLTSFKIVQLINAIFEYNNTFGDADRKRVYIVRNQKAFLKYNAQNVSDVAARKYYLNAVMDILMEELCRRMVGKATYIKYPKKIDIACPTSEKNFIGNLPYGSRIPLGANGIVGIYWENRWGTRDFDLSVLDAKNNRIGWNTNYYDKNKCIVYSGDMTNADPNATEIIYLNGCNIPDAMVNVNRFNGVQGSRYDIFIADEHISHMKASYSVDPSNVVYKASCISNSRMQCSGVISNNKFYVMSFDSGNGRIASRTGMSSTDFMETILRKSKSHLMLKDLLSACGFVDVDTVDELPEDANVIDLESPTKDSLISLFS